MSETIYVIPRVTPNNKSKVHLNSKKKCNKTYLMYNKMIAFDAHYRPVHVIISFASITDCMSELITCIIYEAIINLSTVFIFLYHIMNAVGIF